VVAPQFTNIGITDRITNFINVASNFAISNARDIVFQNVLESILNILNKFI